MVGYADPPRVITDTERAWLEEASAPEPEYRSDCCAKCRRGTKAHGRLPCGYLLNCPNGCHDH